MEFLYGNWYAILVTVVALWYVVKFRAWEAKAKRLEQLGTQMWHEHHALLKQIEAAKHD